MLVPGHISVPWTVFATSDALALASVIESLLVTARVFGSVGESSDSVGSFCAGLKLVLKTVVI